MNIEGTPMRKSRIIASMKAHSLDMHPIAWNNEVEHL